MLHTYTHLSQRVLESSHTNQDGNSKVLQVSLTIYNNSRVEEQKITMIHIINKRNKKPFLFW